MTNNTFKIRNEEKNRILNLHETATKKYNLIKEQGESLPFIIDFANTFNSGDYKFNPNYEQLVNTNLKKISDYIRNNKLKSFDIEIIPGESQVPNQPPFDKVPGSLARKRGEVLKKYLDDNLPALLGFSPNVKVNEPVIGTQTFTVGKDSKDDEKYKAEQFVRAKIVLTNEPKKNEPNIEKGADLVDKVTIKNPQGNDSGIGFIFDVSETYFDPSYGYRSAKPSYKAIVIFPENTEYYMNTVGGNKNLVDQAIEKAKIEHKTNVVQRGTTEQNNYEPWAIKQLKLQRLFTPSGK